MSAWEERARENLLPMSREKENLREALKEWHYTRETVEVEREHCQLCEQPELLYHFEIANRFTANALWVGSTCITKFEIAVLDEGRLLQGGEASRVVAKDRKGLISDAKHRRALTALVALAGAAPSFPFDRFLRAYRYDRHVSPKQASMITWQANSLALGSIVNIADFKIALKSKRDKEGMQGLKPFQRRQIAPALTPAQRKWCEVNIGSNWQD
jgi:hypothetical protein